MNLSRAYFNPLSKSNISYEDNIFKLLAKIINCSVLKGAHCQLRPATLHRDRLKGVQILLSNSQAGPDRQIPVLTFPICRHPVDESVRWKNQNLDFSHLPQDLVRWEKIKIYT